MKLSKKSVQWNYENPPVFWGGKHITLDPPIVLLRSCESRLLKQPFWTLWCLRPAQLGFVKGDFWKGWILQLEKGWFTTWWLNQPIWKIWSSKWVHLPQVSWWKFKKYLSCHHLVYFGPKKIQAAKPNPLVNHQYVDPALKPISAALRRVSEHVFWGTNLQPWYGVWKYKKPGTYTSQNHKVRRLVGRFHGFYHGCLLPFWERYPLGCCLLKLTQGKACCFLSLRCLSVWCCP